MKHLKNFTQYISENCNAPVANRPDGYVTSVKVNNGTHRNQQTSYVTDKMTDKLTVGDIVIGYKFGDDEQKESIIGKIIAINKNDGYTESITVLNRKDNTKIKLDPTTVKIHTDTGNTKFVKNGESDVNTMKNVWAASQQKRLG